MLPRPGDITTTYMGEEIYIYSEYPVDNGIAGIPWRLIDKSDGLIFVLAHVGRWCYVLTSSMKLGWVYEFDVGVDNICGAVYHVS